jgi:hypothetical protein
VIITFDNDVRELSFVMTHSAQCISSVTFVLRSLSVYKTVLLLQLSLIPLRTLPSLFHRESITHLFHKSLLFSLPVSHIVHQCSGTSITPPHPAFPHFCLSLLISLFYYYTLLLQSSPPSSHPNILLIFLPACLPDCLPSSLPYFLSFSTLISLSFFHQCSI